MIRVRERRAAGEGPDAKAEYSPRIPLVDLRDPRYDERGNPIPLLPDPMEPERYG